LLVRHFTSDEPITAKIKEGAEEKLKKILAIDASDDDIIKDLKTQPIDKLLNEFKSYEGDEIAYVVELIERFYLE